MLSSFVNLREGVVREGVVLTKKYKPRVLSIASFDSICHSKLFNRDSLMTCFLMTVSKRWFFVVFLTLQEVFSSHSSPSNTFLKCLFQWRSMKCFRISAARHIKQTYLHGNPSTPSDGVLALLLHPFAFGHSSFLLLLFVVFFFLLTFFFVIK